MTLLALTRWLPTQAQWSAALSTSRTAVKTLKTPLKKAGKMLKMLEGITTVSQLATTLQEGMTIGGCIQLGIGACTILYSGYNSGPKNEEEPPSATVWQTVKRSAIPYFKGAYALWTTHHFYSSMVATYATIKDKPHLAIPHVAAIAIIAVPFACNKI